ncbi:hypothetical protein WHR41_04332 [Cladosporium halotolerans]|uniref:Oxidation resistance protein 1 n=1 Tax=Cladosporium halotolerans TaxID=1052096 RepID=A0AB34KSX6_9PEZI
MESPTHDPPSPSSSSPPLRPPHRKSLSNLTSALSYFTEPVSYTFAGVVRRISTDDAPTPLARALSANYNGSMDSAVFNPPIRRLSPFQPPPLTPLTLEGYKDSTPAQARLLSKAVAEEIRLLVPPRLQLAEHWQLAYSLEQDGSTLSTLYANASRYRGKRAGFVLVVRDSTNGIFGAYLSDPPRPHASYYGSGECFLWRALRLPALPDLSSLPPPPSADTTNLQRMTTVGVAKKQHALNNNHANSSSSASLSSLNVPTNGNGNGHRSGTSTPEQIRFKAFPFSGENDFSIFCQADYLSVGGGDGHYGLWLDAGLSKGVSDTCPTFGNEPLSDEGKKFDVLGVELWYVGS